MANHKYKLANTELAAFCAQLALILKAGVSLEEGLLAMLEDHRDSAGGRILAELHSEVEFGEPLSAALTKTGIYPKYMINMVEIGEASGRLDEVLESLSAYYERSDAIQKNIKSSVTHPALLILMMLVVILVLVIEVLPIFEGVFLQLGSEMSAFAQGIIDVGGAISRYSVVILAVAAAIVAAIVGLRLSAGGRRFLSGISRGMFRKLSSAMASGRFASAMSLMLSSGMDVDKSLDMTYELIDNPRVREKIDRMKADMAEGARFSDAVSSNGLFSGMHARMITVGFKTGTLESVMSKVASFYEEETASRINKLISGLEPALVAVLSLIVGMILLSVMLPLLGIMSAIN